MKVAIHGKIFKDEKPDFIYALLEALEKNKIQYFLSSSLKESLSLLGYPKKKQNNFTSKQDLPQVDLFISIGGDGTFLDSITYIGEKETPILGINTGRLGFLTSMVNKEIDKIVKNIANKDYEYEKRTLVRLDAEKDVFNGLNFALNEFAVTKLDNSSMIVVHAYINEEYLNSYWADGLIISTPTGSTGYSLSCGGPIVFPQSSNFLITPVSAHNLSTRPLVVSDNCVIRLKVESRGSNILVSLDSRSEVIETDYILTIQKERFHAKIVRFKHESFLNILRDKLNWGVDLRN